MIILFQMISIKTWFSVDEGAEDDDAVADLVLAVLLPVRQKRERLQLKLSQIKVRSKR